MQDDKVGGRRRLLGAVHEFRLTEAESGARLVICAETSEFRRSARQRTDASDLAVELGCSFGDTTAILLPRVMRVVAADVADTVLKEAAQRLGPLLKSLPGGEHRLHLQQLDVLRYSAQLDELMPLDTTCVFIDLGGNRSHAALLPLLDQIAARDRAGHIGIRLVVVKCRDLSRRVANAYEKGTLSAPGELSCWAVARAALDGECPSMLANAARGSTDQSAAAAAAAAPPPDVTQNEDDIHGDQNPNCSAGETRLCFAFLNHGSCNRGDGCSFRHLHPEHPEAVEDRRRRATLGWLPQRLRTSQAQPVRDSL